MQIDRRAFMGATAAVVAAGLPRLDPTFFINSAYAQTSTRPMVFLGAEALTGNWDPTTHTNLGQIIVENFVFGYLTRCPMRPDKPDELDYELATAITQVDKYTLEFKLRDGVTFHDGKKFGADDVKATYEYGSQPDRAAQWYPGLVEVEVVDPLTARIKTQKYGYPAALFYYLSSFLPILSAHDVADKKVLAARMNGTGPFKFVEQKGDSTVLTANDAYFMGKPKVPGVHYNFVGDTTTRTLALLSGGADLIERLEQEQVDTISKNPQYVINKAISVENKYLWFRCSKPPFNDVRLRQAAAHAIDRSAILDILGVSGAKSSAHISPVKFGYIDVPDFPEFDADKCQALLAEAGFPKGKGLPDLDYYVSVGFYPKTKEYGELITEMLKDQGFPVKLTVLEVAAWGNLLYDRPGGGAGHMIDCGWCTGSPEPDLVLRTHFYSTSKRICGIVDPEIDASLDRERNANSTDERKKILQTDTLPLLAKKVPSLPLFTSVFIHAMNKKLQGIYIYPNGTQDVTTATLA